MASTVTGHGDFSPSPRAEIQIDPADLSGSPDRITVWQFSEDGSREVRDGIAIDPSGGVFLTDYEVPGGVTVTYRVQEIVGGVPGGYLLDLQTQVDWDPRFVVVQDCLVPELAVAVRAESSFAGALKRSRGVSRVVAGGRTMVLAERMGLLEGVPLRCWTETRSDAETLRSVLAAPDALVRTMPAFPVPGNFYCTVKEIPELPFDAHQNGTAIVWDLVGDEVSRLTDPILKPVVDWQRIIDAYATWDELIAAHPTWQSLWQNPPPEA